MVLFKGTYPETQGHLIRHDFPSVPPSKIKTLLHVLLRDAIQIIAIVNDGLRASLLTLWKDGMT